jgi:hypothetical protein
VRKIEGLQQLLKISWGINSISSDFLSEQMAAIKSRAISTLATQKREVYLLITDVDTWTIGWYDHATVKCIMKKTPHVVRPSEIGLSDAFVINAEENIAAVESINRRRIHLVEEEMELRGLKSTAAASDRAIRAAIHAYLKTA